MNDIETLPKGWTVAKLGDLCEIVMGQSPPSDTYNLSGVGLPFFQGKKEFTELHPIVEKWCSQPNKIAENDDILISVRAPVGDTNIADQKCCIGRGLAAIRYSGNNRYVLYFLKLIKQQLNEKGTGTTFKAISGEILRNTKIPLAPLNEQKRILAKLEQLLTDLDKGIEYLETTKQQLKVYRHAVLKWAFEGNWEIKPLGKVANVKRGKSKHRPRNAPELFGGKYPFIQTGDVRAANGRIVKEYTETYSEFGLKQSKLWPKGTLCLTIAANIADTAFLGFDACFPDSVVGITSDPNILNLDYVNFYIQKIKQEIEGKASATAQKNINVEFLETLEIPVPNPIQQVKIVHDIESRLSVCEKIEETIASSLQQAEALRLSIIKKAFEGKLVAQDPNDEPAEKLLERIRAAKGKGKLEKKEKVKATKKKALVNG